MSYPHTKDIEKMMKSDPKMFKSNLLVMEKKKKEVAKKMAKNVLDKKWDNNPFAKKWKEKLNK